MMNKKTLIVIAMVALFSAAVYFFEQGEKDPDVENNQAPSHVKG